MTVRKYTSRSQQTTLTSAVTSGTTSLSVVSVSTLLGGATVTSPQTFTVVIDPDTALEEVVDVTATSGSTILTVSRAIDGSTAQDHSAGAVVRHMVIGRDLREANTHAEASSSYTVDSTAHTLHGLGSTDGVVVGSTQTIALTNKDLSSATNTLSSSVVTLTGSQTLTNKTLTSPTINGGTVSSAAVTSSTIASGTLSTDLAAGGNKVTGLGTPTSGSDAATKTYADTKLPLAGGTLTGALDVSSNKITSVAAPTVGTDAANKNYVDTQISNLVASAPSTLDTLKELADAIGDDPNFATTVTNSIATKLPKAGGSMTGAIDMGSNKITSLGTPTLGTDAVTKTYADGKLALTGGTMSGAISMGSNKITNVTDPTAAQDVVTKNYSDTLFGSTAAAATSAASAAASATAAATSASSAATSASNALTSQNAAATSATSAAASASAAATSANSAAASATAAATSATNAALSATAAATSATSAAASATAAANSASNALTSASSALTSQTAAATSATSAAASATAAATSAASAATSASSAATTYTAYDQRYLGSKASAPTVDNQGNALITGATYWNTTTNTMYAWSGSVWSAISSASAVTNVTGTAGRISSSGGSTPAIDLVTTAVTPGSYTYASLTVDGYGRLTSASNGTQPVTSISSTNLTVGGTTAAPTINMPATAVTAGSYTNTSLTVDAYGRITAASNGSTAVTSVSGTLNQITSTGGTTPTLALATTAVTPGSYPYGTFTVDAYGRITAASTPTTPVTSVSGTTGNILSSGGTTPAIDLATTAVTPGSYTNASLTVDAYGRLTSASNGSTAVTSVSGTTGNISSTGGTAPVLDLVSTAVTAGSYTYGSFTVDAKGRLTAASNGTTPATLSANTFTGAQTAPSFIVNASTIPANGIYLPAANTLGFASSSGLRMQINSSGEIGVGGSAVTGTTIVATKSMNSSSGSYGIHSNGTIGASSTSTARYYIATGSTIASAFALPTLEYYYATQGTFGAGSSVTSQIGFSVASTLTGATNNYGFYGNIPAAANRWNTYMNGTAANYFAGQTTVGSTSLTLGAGSVAQQFGVVSSAASNVVEVIRATASQTGDLTQWQDSTGAVLTRVNATGGIELNGKDIELMTLMGAY